jgi:signal transduction histidine kinase
MELPSRFWEGSLFFVPFIILSGLERYTPVTKKLLSLVLFVAFLSLFARAQQPPVAQNGILDLRKVDLFKVPVKLSGEWAFYWQQLLTPDSMMATPPAYVRFPVLWNNITLNGKQLPAQGYATYSLKILLPSRRPRIGMDIPEVYCAYKLFVNGVLQSQNGQTATTASAGTPYWGPRTIALPSGEKETLLVILQVANFWHNRGGPYKEMRIGDKDILFLKKNRDQAYDFMLAGCLFMGGLFFLSLFVFGRHDKTTLYFAIFCLLYSYRVVGTDFYALHSLFANLNWFITVRVEYLTLSLGVVFFTAYTRHLYPEDAHPLVMKTMIWFCLLYSAVVIFTSSLVFTHYLNFFLVVMFFCIAYGIYVYICAARHRRSGSIYALASTAVLMFIFLMLNLRYFELVPEIRLIIFVSYVSFFFLQSLSLSHRFAESFRQAAFHAQQGLKAKSEFLSTMSHEIRTPLNSVIGMTHLLLRKDPRSDQKEDLGVLLFSANNLLSIVNNILDYNKIEEGKIGFEQIPMDLPAIARNIIAGLSHAAHEKGIGLHFDTDERLNRKLLGDPTRTTQVITNLVHNAVKFTREGSVRLSIGVNTISPESVTVLVKVADTGIGIPGDKQQMIFERFTQADSSTSRSYGGTGLGLAITRRILELQGVTLQLKSESGKGSEFFFTQRFNFSSEETLERQDNAGSSRRQKLLEGVCLLLVEDNPLNVLVARTILENSGASVDVAVNGSEALRMLDAARHRLVLMDLHMPVMDGYEATLQLRKRGETLPIIALTASTPKEVESEAYAAGLSDVIVKPFNPDDLYRVILQHIRLSPQ